MVIKKVRLENFRGFVGVHEFELHSDHINVIIGANGAGKTSVLNAISYPLIKIFNSDYRRNEFGGIFNVDHRLNVSYTKTKTDVSFSLITNDKLFNLGYKFTWENHNREVEFAPNEFKFPNLPIFNVYDKNRDLNKYNNFFGWYAQQINLQNNERNKIAEKSKQIKSVLNYEIPSLSLVNRAVKIFIKELTDNTFSKITLDKSLYSDQLVLFIEKIDSSRIIYDQLSSGEKAVFCMLLEIAQDAYKYNSELENPLLASGIVIIDEIELHLHPKWQTSILQALNKTFPNIQFIVTTHSPLVINHLKNENLILLDDFKITEGLKVHNIYGRDVNSIITDFMGASAKPKEVENLINAIEVLLDEEKLDINLAKEKLSKLKDLTDPNHSDALKLETLITIEEED